MLTIRAIQSVYARVGRPVLGDVQDFLTLQGEAGASLQGVLNLPGRQQTAGRIEIVVEGAQIDVEDLFQVVDDRLGVGGGW